ncbi:nicotinate-nucleotide adenylyltransferase [Paludisphaera rhizosphaerae]|uniref:nicotinate-nucleotide adenylyltransferase n=1 Tax=Paludisphaera rhizosphaerae TaxID=2711216 RepID=UPI0013EB8E12|nr:nicotinate-nucleotide adenylyltransferase [Paludisphaera rhizosphaerae]
MRLGLFGGTFDPIHIGHLILAEQCREACRLDKVWIVVAKEPPHKRGIQRTAVHHRLEMARLAVAGDSSFEVSEIEAQRSGPSYSVDTLSQIQAERPDDELFFLIGGDSLVDLPTWREPDRIAQMATIVVANRPGSTPETPPSSVFGPDSRPFQHVTIPPIGISSSDLRRRMVEGHSVRYMIPKPVQAYIAAHKLYPAASDVSPNGG